MDTTTFASDLVSSGGNLASVIDTSVTSSDTTDTSSSDDSSDNTTLYVVLGIVGGIVGVAIAGAIAWCLCCRKDATADTAKGNAANNTKVGMQHLASDSAAAAAVPN